MRAEMQPRRNRGISNLEQLLRLREFPFRPSYWYYNVMNLKGTTGKKKNMPGDERRIDFRPREHYQFLAQAAKHAGLSINGWLVNVALEAARRELGVK